jgi:hypothetical protein
MVHVKSRPMEPGLRPFDPNGFQLLGGRPEPTLRRYKNPWLCNPYPDTGLTLYFLLYMAVMESLSRRSLYGDANGYDRHDQKEARVTEQQARLFTKRRRTTGGDRCDWLCAGAQRWRISPYAAGASDTVLRMLSDITSRVTGDTWIRYYIDLAHSPPAPSGIVLTPVTETIISDLQNHPDREQRQLCSGFRFWNHGLKRAFVWLDEEGPLCMQWLLTERDNDRLGHLPSWSGMYPPIPKEYGQVENLYTFSAARRKGVASQFEFMMYEQAKRLELTTLVTHIHAGNTAARAWAKHTGWSPYGVIRRYTFDAPGVRDRAVYVHKTAAKNENVS